MIISLGAFHEFNIRYFMSNIPRLVIIIRHMILPNNISNCKLFLCLIYWIDLEMSFISILMLCHHLVRPRTRFFFSAMCHTSLEQPGKSLWEDTKFGKHLFCPASGGFSRKLRWEQGILKGLFTGEAFKKRAL